MIDAREEAPLNATTDMYSFAANASEYGYLGIAVPGDLHGLWTAFKNFGSGRVSWAALLQPTIDLCMNGLPVSPELARAIRSNAAYINDTTNYLE